MLSEIFLCSSSPPLSPTRNKFARPGARFICPNPRSFLTLKVVSRCSWGPVSFVTSSHTNLLVLWAVYGVVSILLRHLNSNAWIRRSVSAVIVHDSHPYNAVDMTIALIGLSFDAVDTLLLLHMILSFANVPVAIAILVLISHYTTLQYITLH